MSTREMWVQGSGTAEVGEKGGKACKVAEHGCRSCEGLLTSRPLFAVGENEREVSITYSRLVYHLSGQPLTCNDRHVWSSWTF